MYNNNIFIICVIGTYDKYIFCNTIEVYWTEFFISLLMLLFDNGLHYPRTFFAMLLSIQQCFVTDSTELYQM